MLTLGDREGRRVQRFSRRRVDVVAGRGRLGEVWRGCLAHRVGARCDVAEALGVAVVQVLERAGLTVAVEAEVELPGHGGRSGHLAHVDPRRSDLAVADVAVHRVGRTESTGYHPADRAVLGHLWSQRELAHRAAVVVAALAGRGGEHPAFTWLLTHLCTHRLGGALFPLETGLALVGDLGRGRQSSLLGRVLPLLRSALQFEVEGPAVTGAFGTLEWDLGLGDVQRRRTEFLGEVLEEGLELGEPDGCPVGLGEAHAVGSGQAFLPGDRLQVRGVQVASDPDCEDVAPGSLQEVGLLHRLVHIGGAGRAPVATEAVAVAVHTVAAVVIGRVAVGEHDSQRRDRWLAARHLERVVPVGAAGGGVLRELHVLGGQQRQVGDVAAAAHPTGEGHGSGSAGERDHLHLRARVGHAVDERVRSVGDVVVVVADAARAVDDDRHVQTALLGQVGIAVISGSSRSGCAGQEGHHEREKAEHRCDRYRALPPCGRARSSGRVPDRHVKPHL